MLDKLDAIKGRFDNLGIALTNPEIVSDNKKFTAISKEYRSLEKIVTARNEYIKVLDDIEFNKEVLSGEDAEMRDLAKLEISGLEQSKEAWEKALRNMLIPKDPYDEKNAILEIRAGTGGDEASLFAGNLLRMYIKYCEKKGWKTALLSESEGTAGGFKEVQVEVVGDDVDCRGCSSARDIPPRWSTRSSGRRSTMRPSTGATDVDCRPPRDCCGQGLPGVRGRFPPVAVAQGE